MLPNLYLFFLCMSVLARDTWRGARSYKAAAFKLLVILLLQG